jgi:hypothetical protein
LGALFLDCHDLRLDLAIDGLRAKFSCNRGSGDVCRFAKPTRVT